MTCLIISYFFFTHFFFFQDDAIHQRGIQDPTNGWRSEIQRAVTRADNAAVFSVVLLIFGVVQGSHKYLFLSMCCPVFGLVLRLSPFVGIQLLSSHFIHIGSLCLAMLQTWMLLFMIGWIHVCRYCRRCCFCCCCSAGGCCSAKGIKQQETGEEEEERTGSEETKEAKETKESKEGGKSETKTKKDPPAGLFERAPPLLRSTSVPLPSESSRTKVDHQYLQQEAAAEAAPLVRHLFFF